MNIKLNGDDYIMASKEEDQMRLGLGNRPIRLDDSAVAPLDGATVEVSFRTQEPSLEDSVLLSRPADTSQPGYDVLSPLRELGFLIPPSEYVASFEDKIEVSKDEELRDLVPPVSLDYLFERAKGIAYLEASLATEVGKQTAPIEIEGVIVHWGVDDDQDFTDAQAETTYKIGYVNVGGKNYALAFLQVNPSAELESPVYLKQLGDALKGLPGNAPHRAILDLSFEFASEDGARQTSGKSVYLAADSAVTRGDLPSDMEAAVVTNKEGYVGPARSKVDVEFALNPLGERTFGLLKPKSGFGDAYERFTRDTYSGDAKTLHDIAVGK